MVLTRKEVYDVIRKAGQEVKVRGGSFEDFTYNLALALEGCKYSLTKTDGDDAGMKKFEELIMQAQFDGDQKVKRLNDRERDETRNKYDV